MVWTIRSADVDRWASQPSKVVVEEAIVLVPTGHVAAEGSLLEGVYLVQATQPQFAVVEARIDVGIDVLRIQLFDEHPPRGLACFPRQQTLFSGDAEVPLVEYECGVGEQEASTRCRSPRRWHVCAVPRRTTSLPGAQLQLSEQQRYSAQNAGSKRKGGRLEEHPAGRPDETTCPSAAVMHINMFGIQTSKYCVPEVGKSLLKARPRKCIFQVVGLKQKARSFETTNWFSSTCRYKCRVRFFEG